MKITGYVMIMLVAVLALAACSVLNPMNPIDANAAASADNDMSMTTTLSSTPTGAVAASVDEALAEKSEPHSTVVGDNWRNEAIVAISLNGDSITVNGEGVTVESSKAAITSAGTYMLSGSLEDGQVIVNTDSDQVVRLVLNGVDIRNSSSAPIYIEKADETVIVLAEGTENFISDGTEYVFENPADNEPNGAIFSNSDLSITGSGSLTVKGNFNDGISSDDGLIITGGTITVDAVDDGIRGKDYLVIENGIFFINAQGDGLKSDNEEDATRGFVLIKAGAFQITAGGDGIQAETDVLIHNGSFTITSGGGSNQKANDSISSKGIKGVENVNVDGGTFNIDSADDALHSNGNITINNGEFTIATGDDGMHADSTLTVNSGAIFINRSYEGLESAVITINAGDIYIVSSDDGINVAGGGDGSGFIPGQGGFGARPGRGQAFGGGPGTDFFAAAGDYQLYINGGYVAITASGDGIDSNGTIEMTGGVVLINGPTESMNGALDHAGFSMSGGYLVAAGSAGMAQSPGDTSSQYSVMIYLTSTQPAGTLIHIQNIAGEEILTFAHSKQYQSVVFSSPDLVRNETYQIYIGGRSTGTEQNGLIQGGIYTPGTLHASFTVSNVITVVGDSPGGFRGRP